MKDLTLLKKTVVILVDAKNTDYSKLKCIISLISQHGHVVKIKAYGDWTNTDLKYWDPVINDLTIQQVQDVSNNGKTQLSNSAMIIDAMDLLHSKKFDAFVLVSDCIDFTNLAIRLKESDKIVIGAGTQKISTSYKNVCDDYINTNDIESLKTKCTDTKISTRKKENPVILTIDQVKDLIIEACTKCKYRDGWSQIQKIEKYVKTRNRNFDPNTYNSQSFENLIEKMNDTFEIRSVVKRNNQHLEIKPILG